MESSDGNNRFESWQAVGNAQDGCESTGLKEEEGDVRVVEAGRISRRQ